MAEVGRVSGQPEKKPGYGTANNTKTNGVWENPFPGLFVSSLSI